ncbi:hypothetical protein TW86_04045 [Halomonas sp. S2151]|uniref:hypothetical protein n=1 Tax=Halomonas sp. S2151 TaxID=579478 RepID=UPI0005FA2E63|nr:hypothetical protein [Halomonas sp. S2151]KJZ17431.1 hypothetical protein TW86_04045 [Halomonas sp. S2151]
MAAGIYTIVCEKRASFRLDITHTNNDGTPIHLGGFHAQMDVRRSRTTNSKLITSLSTDNGRIQIPAPETGEILLAMAPEDTAELPPGDYFYDVVIYRTTTHPDGSTGKEVVRLLEGNFVIRQGVTDV